MKKQLKSFLIFLSVIIFASVFAVSCSDDDDDSSVDPPRMPEDLEEGWNVLRPGGETICSRGTEFAYYAHPGTVNRLVIDFQGGGACWTAGSCGFADAIFNPDVNVEATMEMVNSGEIGGIYDRTNPENPFKDWYHVHVPYCTGDIHWGNSVVTYDEGKDSEVTINHKGAVNAGAVIDWVFANFEKPEKIFITGCSAGAYGSIGWAPVIMEHYKDSEVYQMGDCGAGVITENFFRESFPSWNVEDFMPTWIPEVDPGRVDILELDLPLLYIHLANYYSDFIFSQYNTAYDENQSFYYEAMGGEGGQKAWSEKMFDNVDRIKAGADNYRAFIAPGEKHCVIMGDEFYQYQAEGVRIVDWVTDMINDEPIYSVASTSPTVP